MRAGEAPLSMPSSIVTHLFSSKFRICAGCAASVCGFSSHCCDGSIGAHGLRPNINVPSALFLSALRHATWSIGFAGVPLLWCAEARWSVPTADFRKHPNLLPSAYFSFSDLYESALQSGFLSHRLQHSS
jgi:hypothetical protein